MIVSSSRSVLAISSSNFLFSVIMCLIASLDADVLLLLSRVAVLEVLHLEC